MAGGPCGAGNGVTGGATQPADREGEKERKTDSSRSHLLQMGVQLLSVVISCVI